jgi:hypothetical protein
VPRSLGLTDPPQGYNTAGLPDLPPTVGVRPIPSGDGLEFYDTSNNNPVTLDQPIDSYKWTSEIWRDTVPPNGNPQGYLWTAIPSVNGVNAGLKDDGIIPSVMTFHLQRLADPTEPWDPKTNPYRTVDSLGGDILSFNGASSEAEYNPNGDITKFFASFERADFDRQFDDWLSPPGNLRRERLLWKGTHDGRSAPPTTPSIPQTGDNHFLSFNVRASLGDVDLGYRSGITNANSSFPWLSWSNRPLYSALELLNVPFTPPSLLTSRFDLVWPGNAFNATPRYKNTPDTPN